MHICGIRIPIISYNCIIYLYYNPWMFCYTAYTRHSIAALFISLFILSRRNNCVKVKEVFQEHSVTIWNLNTLLYFITLYHDRSFIKIFLCIVKKHFDHDGFVNAYHSIVFSAVKTFIFEVIGKNLAFT